MESMDVLECMVRDRLINARARARIAALLVDANGPQGQNATVKTRFADLGRNLVNAVRKVVDQIFHAMPGRTRIAKNS